MPADVASQSGQLRRGRRHVNELAGKAADGEALEFGSIGAVRHAHGSTPASGASIRLI